MQAKQNTAGHGSEYHNELIKSWLQNNDIEMYSTYNEGKCVATRWFIRILKENVTSVWKSVYIIKLDDIVNEYNNTYHRTIKMKLDDVKPSLYIDFGIESNDKNPNFKAGNHVRISK